MRDVVQTVDKSSLTGFPETGDDPAWFGTVRRRDSWRPLSTIAGPARCDPSGKCLNHRCIRFQNSPSTCRCSCSATMNGFTLGLVQSVQHHPVLPASAPCSPELNMIKILWKQAKYCWHEFATWSKDFLQSKVSELLDGFSLKFQFLLDYL